LDHEHADVIVTPVVKQVLPGYTLVSGQDDAVQLAKILQPKFIVTLKNGDLESQGVLSWIVVEKGTVQSFKVCPLSSGIICIPSIGCAFMIDCCLYSPICCVIQSLLYKSLPDVEVLEPEPGVPLQVPI
jgi:hypothetical protein